MKKALTLTFFILFLFTTILISLTSCISQSDDQTHKLVTPTQQELDEITSRLDPIFSMFHSDYDSSVDNIYEYMFDYNQLDYVYPYYNDEVKKYIAEPCIVSEYGNMLWYEWNIPQNDPLGKFPKIRDEVYDENGNISEDLANDLQERENLYWQDVIIGHNKFSGEYIDWLVEGVWNGTVDHNSFMVFKDGTRLYYHDSFYYTPECIGDRGGGIMYAPVIDKITPLENNKYQIEYHLLDEFDNLHSRSKAVIGLKETKDGFRFWSVFSIDYDIGE